MTLLFARLCRPAFGAVLLAVLAACGPATLPPGDSIEDAAEARNREVHRFNVALDQTVVAPVAEAYGEVVPRPLRTGIGNAAANLSQPGYVVNDLLQLRLQDALQNSLRFAVNSTIGIGGLLDPATAMGLPAAETDFGETMHVYGLGEGDYLVAPLFGPSTTRDTVGRIVDIAFNPLRQVLGPREVAYAAGSLALAGLDTRLELSGTIDSLYRSEDSYALTRSVYLQNRRFELRGGGADAPFDPYAGQPAAQTGADPGAQADPVLDPYFDPYAM
jgi:phospholipid-binding lipoprotein MlaA